MSRRFLPPLLVLTLSLTLAACSEEHYGLLRCNGGVDTLIVYPRQEVQYVTVIGAESGMAGMKSLYLGSSGGTRSDFLLEFDFSTFQEDYPDYPDSLFELDKIKYVSLGFQRLRIFRSDQDSVETSGVIYEVRSLANGFDPQEYITAPGPAVPLDGRILNQDSAELNHEDEPYLELSEQDLIDWITNKESVGMVVTAAAGSDPGLVGFSSLESDHYGIIPAPSILVSFHDWSLRTLKITPTNDTSTFDKVADLPADMLHLQTGLQSYPVLTFDIPALPAESSKYVIYGFSFFADSIDPFWVGSCLDVSQLAPGMLEAVPEPVLAGDLEAAATPIFRICEGGETSEYPDQFTPWGYPSWEPAPPSVMHLLFTYPKYSMGHHPDDAEVYFSQSTFFGPNVTGFFRPVLLVITCNPGE